MTFHYHDWSGGEYDIAAEIAATKFDYDERRWYFTLRVDPFELDKTDREGLEGPDRNLYGWVTSRAISKPVAKIG